MTELIKIAIGISVITTLLAAIDFGRDDINKVKEQVISILNSVKDNPQTAGQKLQDTITLLQEQLKQQQMQPQSKIIKEQTIDQQQTQQQKPNNALSNFYSGGNWTPKEFYKQ